ncbi:MAG TPA: TonB-dependent receptor [Thermoanaerobaculia bacterium]|jgi:outer membrane receptor protein involved in Fe transport
MQKRNRWATWSALAVGMLLAAQAFAQIPSATLTGRVTDDSGVGLPGVLVSANSESVQGTKTTYTGANGDYKIPFLPPGIYEATYQLDGFTESSRELKLSAAQTMVSNIALRPAEVIEETIVVTSNFETISRTSSGSSTYTKDEMESLAIERDLDDAALMAPGVTATGPGGTEATPVITISGAMSFENLFLVNGVSINENIRGQELPLFIEDAIAETTTTVSSVSAEYGRFTGGVVNVITKSGGNQIEGSIRSSLSNDDWIARAGEQGALFSGSPERDDTLNETYEATLGGAFWKDHIWFFGAGRDLASSETRQTPALLLLDYPYAEEEQRIEGKLTFAATQRHNVVGSYIEIDRTTQNAGSFTFIDLDSLSPNRQDPQEIKAINYNGVLSSNFFLEAQYSERDFAIGVGSGGPQDLIEGTLWRTRINSWRFHTPTFCGGCEQEIRNNENFLAKGSYFLTSKSAGTHDLVFGYDTYDDIRFAVNHQTGSDFTTYASDIVANFNTGEVFPVVGSNARIQWFAIINLDIAQPTSFKTNSLYVNDAWQLSDKWSFNLGLRYDENDGSNSAGALVADDAKVSPRLSLTYDTKGDGDLLLNASYGTYVAGVANSRADSTSDGGAVSSFVWDYGGPQINTDPSLCSENNTSGCVSSADALRIMFDWYESVGGRFDDPFLIDPNSPLETDFFVSRNVPGATAQILDTIKSPSADELTVGVIKRLGSKGTFRADLVHRDWSDFYSNRTTLETGRVQLPNGNFADLTEVGNFGDDGLKREYTGLHTQLRYNLSDRLRVGATYALSKVEGNINGETGPSGPVPVSVNSYAEYFERSWSDPNGDLATDQRHKLRAWAIYDLLDREHHSLSVSWMENFFSGSPYGAAALLDSRPFVTNPGYLNPPSTVVYYFTDRDAFHTDDLHRSDLSFNYSFRWQAFGRSMQVFLQPEILNIFGEEAAVGHFTGVSGPAAGTCPMGVLNADGSRSAGRCAPFNPFTETPVEGINWAKQNGFGDPLNENSVQRPRLFRLSVGFRF